MPAALHVAQYFIATADQDEGVSNLKLQNLCAYAQGVCLGFLGRPLFTEDLEAWAHGPVEPGLYHRYNSCSKNRIEPEGLDVKHARKPFTPEEMLILEMVNEYYGRYPAEHLCCMSRLDFPGAFGSNWVMPKVNIGIAFKYNPLVQHLVSAKEQLPGPSGETVSALEIWNALAN